MENYNHYNIALGKRIYTKKQYQEEMKKGNFIPFSEAKQIAEKRQKELDRPYDKPSDKAISLIKDIHSSGKRDGSVKLSDRQIDAMKKMGMSFNPRFIPTNQKGGFV